MLRRSVEPHELAMSRMSEWMLRCTLAVHE